MECKEAVLRERDTAIRKKFIELELLLIDSIDSVLWFTALMLAASVPVASALVARQTRAEMRG